MKISYLKYFYILIIVFILSILGSFAFFSWGSDDSNNTNVSFDVVAETVYIEYDAGSDIEGANLYPVDDKSDGISKDITVKTDKVSSKPVTFNLYLDLTDVPEELMDDSFKWAIYRDNELVASDSITKNIVECSKNNTNHIVLVNNETVDTTLKKYTLYLWIDGNMTNPDTMMNKSLKVKLHADGENALIKKNMVTYISSLYDDGSKNSVITASGETISQVNSLNVMKDSFGNIRYYGSNPLNYVYYNNELWRIIGIFDTENENGEINKRVKIIRDSIIGSYAFDNKTKDVGSSNSVYGSNDWSDSRLMMLLNPGYEEVSDLYAYEGSLYWNRKLGSCYSGLSNKTKDCDFSSNGLNVRSQSQIDKVKYYLGGVPSQTGVYADDYYNSERGSDVYSGHSTYWYGYVGIMYPSDYAYATDLSSCTKTGYRYNNDSTNCTGKDWLLDSNNDVWTITSHSSPSYNGFRITSDGNIRTLYYVPNAYGVRPVVYLNKDISIVDGNGSKGSPYKIV